MKYDILINNYRQNALIHTPMIDYFYHGGGGGTFIG